MSMSTCHGQTTHIMCENSGVLFTLNRSEILILPTLCINFQNIGSKLVMEYAYKPALKRWKLEEDQKFMVSLAT